MIFAVIENGIVVNSIVLEADKRDEFAAATGWQLVELPQGYGIGDLYADGVFSKV